MVSNLPPTEVRSLSEQSTLEEDLSVHNLLTGIEPADSGDLESSTISLFDGYVFSTAILEYTDWFPQDFKSGGYGRSFSKSKVVPRF